MEINRHSSIPEKMAVYENRIDEELHTFYIQLMESDTASDPATVDKFITDSPQNRFSAALMHVRKIVFKDRTLLKDTKLEPIPGTTIKTNRGRYDYDLLNTIADYYIYLCTKYDKECTIHGYCYLTGVDAENVFYGDRKEGSDVSRKKSELYKKLSTANENSLSDMLATGGKRNPVGVLGILNHRHAWNMPGVTREVSERRTLSVSELPRLDAVQDAQDVTPALPGAE